MTTVVGPATPPLYLTLNQPHGIAIDSAGNLYIADTNNCVVWQVSSNYQAAAVIAGQGGSCGAANLAATGPISATSVTLNFPFDVAACNGIVFLLDQTSIYEVDEKGNFSNIIGNPFHYSPNHLVLDSNGNPGGNVQPQAIACDPAGDLFIQSYYTTQDGAIYSLDALSSAGVSSNLGEIFQGVGTYLGVAADSIGNVYTLNLNALGNGEIAKFVTSNSSGTITVVGGQGVYPAPMEAGYPESPTRIAADPYGNLYTNANRAPFLTTPLVYVDELKVLSSGNFSFATIAGGGTADFNGDGPLAAFMLDLYNPFGLAATCTEVLIADTRNNRIRSLPPNPGTCGATVGLVVAPASPTIGTAVTLTASASINEVTATGGSVSFFDNGLLIGSSQIITSTSQGGVPGNAALVYRLVREATMSQLFSMRILLALRPHLRRKPSSSMVHRQRKRCSAHNRIAALVRSIFPERSLDSASRLPWAR